MDLPSFKEGHISQIPALQLLQKLGYTYLTPERALAARGGGGDHPGGARLHPAQAAPCPELHQGEFHPHLVVQRCKHRTGHPGLEGSAHGRWLHGLFRSRLQSYHLGRGAGTEHRWGQEDLHASSAQKQALFSGAYKYARDHFEALEKAPIEPSAQDALVFNLCRPERLLDLARNFVLVDDGQKKIARYQQYFAVKPKSFPKSRSDFLAIP